MNDVLVHSRVVGGNDALAAAHGFEERLTNPLSVAILVDSSRPFLFAQQRAGLDGKRFRMLKFRTMVADAEARLPQLVSFDALDEPMFSCRTIPA